PAFGMFGYGGFITSIQKLCPMSCFEKVVRLSGSVFGSKGTMVTYGGL
ncbi:hypothetical protein M8C21_012851, partial [Ambrosia artemisiifolia]